MVLSLLLVGYVQVQEVEFDIFFQVLGSVFQEFGCQVDIQVLYCLEEVWNKCSSVIKGKLELNQVIIELFCGIGVLVDFQGNVIIISVVEVVDSSVDFGVIMIIFNQLGIIIEDSGFYMLGIIVMVICLVLILCEMFQLIIVVICQNMDDFGFNNIDDVMCYMLGIIVLVYDIDCNNYYVCGFLINNFQYDGIFLMVCNVGYFVGNMFSDMVIYDWVEVFKGVIGLFIGVGFFGVMINLICKKFIYEFKGYVELGVGSWDNYCFELDVSGLLIEFGNVCGWVVVVYQDKYLFMDYYECKISVYYGIFEFDLNFDIMFIVGVDYQDNDFKGLGWLGSFLFFDSQGNCNDVFCFFNNGVKWSSWEQYICIVFVNFEYNFVNGWVGKV